MPYILHCSGPQLKEDPEKYFNYLYVCKKNFCHPPTPEIYFGGTCLVVRQAISYKPETCGVLKYAELP
jgi:hypothetical protein